MPTYGTLQLKKFLIHIRSELSLLQEFVMKYLLNNYKEIITSDKRAAPGSLS